MDDIDLLILFLRNAGIPKEDIGLVAEWEDQGLVFPNLSGGYLHPNHVGEKFRKLLQKADLPPIHFHDLRHSAATILLSMGVNVKVIQELLGHTDISITLGCMGTCFH